MQTKIKPKFFYITNVFLIAILIIGILTEKHYTIDKEYEPIVFLVLSIMQMIIFGFLSLLRNICFYKYITFELGANNLTHRNEFINLKQKTLKYTDIKEVILKQNFVQRWCGIGTVEVKTHATVQDAGITIYDIKEYQEVYEFILEKIKNN
jgi:uncharacterized membrane protein YdbT with pleckstrin-like domain